MTIPEGRSVAHSEALLYADQAEDASRLIDRLKRDPYAPNRNALLGQAHHRLGIALKLAEVHATLAVASGVTSLRDAILDGAGK